VFRNAKAIDSVEPKNRNVFDTRDVSGDRPAVTGLSAGDLLERAAALRREGQPFVLATVVRALRPASAKPGDRALLFGNHKQAVGWVGGGCVHTSIEREAARALADGAPRLVRLSPEARAEDGIVSYPMTCHSGGTLDIYLEPVLPAPELVVLGESPVAEALTLLGAPLGFRIRSSLDDVATPDAWVVAAAMSSAEDHPAVRAALARGVAYVAMVASRRRTEAFLDELRSEGFSEEVLARLKAPAGLDIGAATGPEIALSILAEIVQRRRSRPLAEVPLNVSETAIDPICGMEVEIATARWTAERDGQTYYFCAPGCRRAFLAASEPSPPALSQR
jgi:xanthine dehydrogenase accessory factor